MSEPMFWNGFDGEEVDWWIAHLRNLGYTVIAPDDTAQFNVRRNAPDTSKAIVDSVRAGSLQAQMLGLFEVDDVRTGGLTDDDIEQVTGRSHQSVSALRNTLVRKGLLRDSGQRRKNRYSNMSIVWVRTEKEPVIR